MRSRSTVLLALVVAAGLSAGAERTSSAGGGGGRRARHTIKGARPVGLRAGARRTGAGATTATPEQRLGQELDGIWSGRILRRGVTAVYVVDARTGEDVYSVHADDKLNPASNVKLLSTATVLDLLGPEWSYLTRVFGAAPDREGVARGDLYLRGSADPTFSMPHLDELAQAAARAGVRRVEGDVVLSDDLLRDTVSAPRISIVVTPGDKPNAPATVTIDPNTSYIQVHVDATTNVKRRAKLSVTTQILDALPLAPTPTTTAPAPAATPMAAPDPTAAPAPAPYDGPRLLINVTGTIRKGKPQSFRRSVGLRSTFTGYMMRNALRAAGIEVTGRVRLVPFDAYTRDAAEHGWLPVELARHRSKTMKELVARTNKRSVNWLADRLLMTAGAEMTGSDQPSLERGVEAMYRWLDGAGVNSHDVVVDTGSGLSHKTKLTARHLVRVLRSAAGFASKLSPNSLLDPSIFLQSLAVGGVDGTLRGRFRSESMRGRVVAKTGTLSSSVALSGFVSDDVGHTLCFAIVTNGNSWNARYRVRREHEQMVAAMKRYLDARTTHAAELAAVAATPAPAPAAVAPAPAVAAPAPAAIASEGAAEAAGDDDEAGGEQDDESAPPSATSSPTSPPPAAP